MEAKTQPWLQASYSCRFLHWLSENNCSLAISTYQAGKLLLIGSQDATQTEDPRITIFERNFKHSMGLARGDRSLWLGTRYQVWKLTESAIAITPLPYAMSKTWPQNYELPGWSTKNYDSVFIPRIGFTTGYIDIHDVAVGAAETVYFVSTMFSCIATTSNAASFTPYWKPGFISALAAEDRCHLNGLAIREGVPAYVTCAGLTDETEGWRECRANGGAVLGIQEGSVICRGLSMPHSPRWYRNTLWVHNSGTGEFGRVSLDTGVFEPIASCPGYLRGLSFHKDYAVASVSKPRNGVFQGLELDNRLKDQRARCGVQVINLISGKVEHSLYFESDYLSEIYDVCVLEGTRRPTAIGLQNDEIEKFVLIDDR